MANHTESLRARQFAIHAGLWHAHGRGHSSRAGASERVRDTAGRIGRTHDLTRH